MRARHNLRLPLLVAVASLTLGGLIASTQPLIAANRSDQGPTAGPVGFAVKFVCGAQTGLVNSDQGEPPVKPGNYATEVNIHNYHLKQPARLSKQVIILVGKSPAGGPLIRREPAITKPVGQLVMSLPAGTATMDDCPAILRLAKLPLSTTLTMGYLIVHSTIDLDVDAVYTAESPGVPGSQALGISEQIVRVAGHSEAP